VTRLRPVDIERIPGNLAEYDADLRRKTGLSLRQIACRAAGVGEDDLKQGQNGVTVAAVPMGSGLGIIEGFSKTVGSIAAQLGFRGFVTEGHDVAGIAEAVEKGGDILMLADDERFVAITSGRGQVVDNVWATARGFVAGLEAMGGGLTGASALVLGCGPVGIAGAEALLERGATVTLLDADRDRAVSALRVLTSTRPDTTWDTTPDRIRVEDGGMGALLRHEVIFEATTTGGFIEPSHLTSRALVVAPGVPCALTPEALAMHGDRILHDVLEIGTATMVVQAFVHCRERGGFGKEAGETSAASDAGRPGIR